MIGANPDFARKMSRVLSERIRKTNAIIQNLLTTNRQNQLWAGLLEYTREHGVSTYKGSRVNVAAFTQWASEHLGMTEKDVEGILSFILRKGFIAPSAKGEDEILVTPKKGMSIPES
jgi:CRP/FNR family cyclic AMP-dependent transcriptional regulator